MPAVLVLLFAAVFHVVTSFPILLRYGLDLFGRGEHGCGLRIGQQISALAASGTVGRLAAIFLLLIVDQHLNHTLTSILSFSQIPKTMKRTAGIFDAQGLSAALPK